MLAPHQLHPANHAAVWWYSHLRIAFSSMNRRSLCSLLFSWGVLLLLLALCHAQDAAPDPSSYIHSKLEDEGFVVRPVTAQSKRKDKAEGWYNEDDRSYEDHPYNLGLHKHHEDQFYHSDAPHHGDRYNDYRAPSIHHEDPYEPRSGPRESYEDRHHYRGAPHKHQRPHRGAYHETPYTPSECCYDPEEEYGYYGGHGPDSDYGNGYKDDSFYEKGLYAGQGRDGDYGYGYKDDSPYGKDYGYPSNPFEGKVCTGPPTEAPSDGSFYWAACTNAVSRSAVHIPCESCTATCNTTACFGPSDAGPPTACCGPKGDWRVKGACVPTGCCDPLPPPPPALGNGSFTNCSAGSPVDKVCDSLCDINFEPSDPPPTATCAPTGEWQLDGECIQIVCTGPPTEDPEDGSFSWEGCADLTPGLNYTGTCNETACLGASNITGPPTAVCGPTGEWQVEGEHVITGCCDPPPALGNGSFTNCSAGSAINTVCDSLCNLNFEPSDPPPTATCDPTGEWQLDGECIQIVCTGPPTEDPEDGSFSWGGCADLTPGLNYTGTCNETACLGASNITGPPTAVCGPTGEWQVEGERVPTGCCDPPPGLGNGCFPSCNSGSPVGTVCDGDCDAGFRPPLIFDDDPSVTCEPTGLWRNVIGECAECLPTGATCTNAGPICCGFCVNSNDPIFGSCGGPGCTCRAEPCFSGDTSVVIQESAAPVAMRELQVGQHVQCVDSGHDLTMPATVKWCEVVNFLHAEPSMVRQTRINFTHLGTPSANAPGSITVSMIHLMLRLTSHIAVGATTDNMTAFGAFETVPALQVQAGDKMVLLSDPDDAAAGFVVAAVSSVESVMAEGIYVPAVEMPYIVADGMVVPLYPDFRVPIVAPADVYDPANVATQYIFAQAYMKSEQPVGTPGKDASWNGSPKWPSALALEKVARRKVRSGLSANFTAMRDWFVPRYAAWKTNNASIISAEQALEFFKSDAAWTTASP